MQTNPAVEQNKNIKWSESPWIQSGILDIKPLILRLIFHGTTQISVRSTTINLFSVDLLSPRIIAKKCRIHKPTRTKKTVNVIMDTLFVLHTANTIGGVVYTPVKER